MLDVNIGIYSARLASYNYSVSGLAPYSCMYFGWVTLLIYQKLHNIHTFLIFISMQERWMDYLDYSCVLFVIDITSILIL